MSDVVDEVGKELEITGVSAGGKVQKLDIKQIMEVLCKLALMNSLAIRDLTGAVFRAFLMDAKCEVALAMAEEGQMYHQAVTGKSPV